MTWLLTPPGPWKARQYSNGIDWGIDAPFGDSRHPLEDYSGFATVYGSENYPRQGAVAVAAEANARLIAAAPDLLEVLEQYLSSDEMSEGYGCGLGDESLRDRARAVIAKATGENHE